MYELGLLDDFLKLPHQRVARLSAQIGEETITNWRLLPSQRPGADSSR
jgi:hypothetical protein